MMNTDSPHLSFETLTGLVMSGFDAPQEAQLHEHLANCQSCMQEFSHLKNITDVMMNDSSEDAPKYLVAQALREFDRYNPAADGVKTQKPSLIDRITAVLQSDSAEAKPAFGVRSGQPSPVRQLVYSAGDYVLDLRIELEGDNWLVAGQVFGQLDNGEIELKGDAGEFLSGINKLGEFEFPPVPAGIYILRLKSETANIEVYDVKIGI